MVELKNSTLLDRLINAAKALGQRPGALTAERLVLAAAEFVASQQGNAAEQQEIQGFAQYLRTSKVSLTTLRNRLIPYVNADRTQSYLDGLYIQKKLYDAKVRARQMNMTCVTVDVLLKCVLDDPTDMLRSCFADEGLGDPVQVGVGSNFAEQLGFNPFAGLQGFEEELMGAVGANNGNNGNGGNGSNSGNGGNSGISGGDELGWGGTPKANTPKSAVSELIRKVKATQMTLLESVLGQDNAVSVFTTGYFQAELLSLTDKGRNKPKATYLFAGPPGVGKTFLAEKAAEVLGVPFMRFDMSEYADKEAYIEFAGSDEVYKNSKSGNVTSFVDENPKCVLLFDEIEKAHLCVIHLFLQILDAGRLRDNKTDKEVSFRDAIIIFTTNAGKQLYETAESGDFSGLPRKVILKALQNDINPTTGAPFFPGAICSRFASGNVVMFNHMEAHNLRSIARREILRHATNFQTEMGVKISVDEKVFTALLFAEGGNADARTIRARAEAFFDNELFELFRLVAAEKVSSNVEDVESILFRVSLPENPAIRGLFENQEESEILVYTSPEMGKVCAEKVEGAKVYAASTVEEAKQILGSHDICMVLLDMTYGQKENINSFLNTEDVESSARDLFWYLREYRKDMPLYLLQTPALQLTEEERLSFLRQGMRGVIAVSMEEDHFGREVRDVCSQMHQQSAIGDLARANKVLTFETAQCLYDGGKKAEIRLFDFEMAVAVDPEEGENMLSNVSKPNVKFDQVIGAEEAKKELRYFVEYLRNPKKYLATGVRAPKGVLLYGPPGTGKTMLAKAMASESDVTFITAEGNSFLKKYVGEGSEKVHELFRIARKYAPSIIFIDEIDAIAKERRGGDNSSGVEATLTAFLAEMDGFKNDPNKPVFVLAATNFDVEPGGAKSLDPALMRRFDRRVMIDLPDKASRIRYLKMQIAKHPVFKISDQQIENIAIRSTGMSLASLESVIEMALRGCIRDGNMEVTDEMIQEAFETFNSGERKQWDSALLERTARHEAGHAFMCWYGGEVPSYLTVVARAGHGGYMQHGDHENKPLYTKRELLNRIRTSLGGRATEMVYYGPEEGLSTGASGDLSNATAVARRIICTYGMDEKFGLAAVDMDTARSGELSAEVRGAVNEILNREMQFTVELIGYNRAAIDALVAALLEKNQLTGPEIDAILKAHAVQGV